MIESLQLELLIQLLNLDLYTISKRDHTAYFYRSVQIREDALRQDLELFL